MWPLSPLRFFHYRQAHSENFRNSDFFPDFSTNIIEYLGVCKRPFGYAATGYAGTGCRWLQPNPLADMFCFAFWRCVLRCVSAAFWKFRGAPFFLILRFGCVSVAFWTSCVFQVSWCVLKSRFESVLKRFSKHAWKATTFWDMRFENWDLRFRTCVLRFAF